ncbi:MAG: YdcF family protein [Alphaproteobacteria bacterium]|nr:YdcF family protein [Alphaproteobacteria bacterium]
MLGCRGKAGLIRRLDHGIRLFRSGAAPLLLLSGGGTGPVPEAEIMHQMALARGVPETALLVEPRSRDTVENARETARLLRPRGGCLVLLVSDRVHLPRAALLFRLAGLRIAGWVGVPPTSTRWEVGAAVRECATFPKSLVRALLPR